MSIGSLNTLLIFSTIILKGCSSQLGGGAEATTANISKCTLASSYQTKSHFFNMDGRKHFVCSGYAVCDGIFTPVSCKVGETEQCPTAEECIRFKVGDD